ncbi:MAG: NAD-dependent epimerase/dehydratase family protein [Clostridiales bacterium]|jgi:nucleoside-diphosphate-sugar epimerase|nr:NAD-dependent epimerase/dehydratase family protein [Clostridiales bacterium]
MNKAIISGATGFVGTHLCQELIKNGVSVYALCRKNSPNIHRLPKETHIVECSMNDYANLNFDFEKADVFYHLAWEGATGKERANETIQSENARNTLEAVSTAKRIGCKKLVAVGTVYENFYEQVISRDNFNSADFYILSKVYAHRMAEKLASKIGIDFLWCTFFHPIGKYNNLNQMMAYAVKGMLDGNSPSFGSAEQPYDITAV